MPLFSFLIIFTSVISVIFCLLTISRILAYNKKYPLPESKYTKLFKSITKEQVAITYLSFAAIGLIFSSWFALTI